MLVSTAIVVRRMAGRKIRDEEDARACLAAAARSGVRRRDWARAHGVDGRSLHCWYLQLRGPRRRVKSPGPPMSLVELVPAVQAEARTPETGGFVVRLREVEVEVPPDFDGGALLRLLEVLSRC